MPLTYVTDWTPTSWQEKVIHQQPAYPDDATLEAALTRLRALPPLVTSWEIEALKHKLAAAAAGKGFLLQGGDCAERFDDCTDTVITGRLKILLQMSLVLVFGLNTRVVRVGRFAGQYAKPRSSDEETRDRMVLPSYRGDLVNDPAFTSEARTPDPARLLEAYHRSALTLNFVRALAEGGFADLHHPEYWDVDFMAHSPLADEYQALVDAIEDALCFMETVTDRPIESLEHAAFYTSHEALHLRYETALTRPVPHRQGAYNLGAHLPWIGMRTAFEESAHVEYARGLANPVGLKVGTALAPSDLAHLVRTLNPDAAPGKLVLITRLGTDGVANHLSAFIEAVQKTGVPVLWVSDPMHGNTERTTSGLKTRHFDNILAELEQAFEIHAACNSRLGGVHFELTGEDVTECIGGARGLTEDDLERAYKSHVDPRLNYEQALEMAFSIVRAHRRMNR